MVTIIKPTSGEGRIVYEVSPVKPSFTDIQPPIKQGYGKPYEVGNRDFFLEYRKHVLSKYTPSMYKWGENYSPYVPRPKIAYSHRKQRWEEMFSKPQIQLTFKDGIRVREIEDFYLLCQFQRQYYNDYTGTAHPMDYFKKDVDKWSCPPDLNSTYVQCPVTYSKYKQPLTVPLTTKSTWSEPYEPCRRLAGKRDPYPDNVQAIFQKLNSHSLSVSTAFQLHSKSSAISRYPNSFPSERCLRVPTTGSVKSALQFLLYSNVRTGDVQSKPGPIINIHSFIPLSLGK